MKHSRVVLGYHGCRKDVADRLLDGDEFRLSRNDWDWLGHGIYFWENGLQRAVDWGIEYARLKGHECSVVGAWIQLGNCLDLFDTESTEELAMFAENRITQVGKSFPKNQGFRRPGDCQVINMYCDAMQASESLCIDTVRGPFLEGEPLFEGSGLQRKSHIQIAVRNPAMIIGLFKPRSDTPVWKPT